MSLVTVAISIAILSVAGFVFMQMSGSYMFGSSRIAKGLRGQQVLVGVASDLQRQDFTRIVESTCGGITGTEKVLTGNCVAGDTLKKLADQTQPKAGDPLINVLLSENGKVSDTGDTCVELNKCKFVAGGDMLELSLTAYWKDPDPKKGVVSKSTVLRRARW